VVAKNPFEDPDASSAIIYPFDVVGAAADSLTGARDLILRVDGSRPLSAELVAELGAVCDRAEDGDAEDGDADGFVIVRVSGVPEPEWTGDLSVALVSEWERGLRRLAAGAA
jgi:isomerase DpgB